MSCASLPVILSSLVKESKRTENSPGSKSLRPPRTLRPSDSGGAGRYRHRNRDQPYMGRENAITTRIGGKTRAGCFVFGFFKSGATISTPKQLMGDDQENYAGGGGQRVLQGFECELSGCDGGDDPVDTIREAEEVDSEYGRKGWRDGVDRHAG